jgi:hypothetical protein
MSELRLRGDDIQVRLTQGGAIIQTLAAIESLTWTVDSEIIQKGYLGEGSDRVDEIYKTTSVDVGVDQEGSEGIFLMQSIATRSTRRTAQASTQVNISFVANYPNGSRPRVTIIDVKFQGPSMGVANRDAYGMLRLNGKARKFQISGV